MNKNTEVATPYRYLRFYISLQYDTGTASV